VNSTGVGQNIIAVLGTRFLSLSSSGGACKCSNHVRNVSVYAVTTKYGARQRGRPSRYKSTLHKRVINSRAYRFPRRYFCFINISTIGFWYFSSDLHFKRRFSVTKISIRTWLTNIDLFRIWISFFVWVLISVINDRFFTGLSRNRFRNRSQDSITIIR